MSSSYTKLFVHFVWATKFREHTITPVLAPRIHGYLSSRCRAMNCFPLAVGGVSDHAHVLVWMSPEVGVAQLARELKAPTTRFIHRELNLPEFAWQEGYGAFTLRESEVELVRRYVDNQARHHSDGSVVEGWEQSQPLSVGQTQ
jgi:REP element-mobilizing transposase RayT